MSEAARSDPQEDAQISSDDIAARQTRQDGLGGERNLKRSPIKALARPHPMANGTRCLTGNAAQTLRDRRPA